MIGTPSRRHCVPVGTGCSPAHVAQRSPAHVCWVPCCPDPATAGARSDGAWAFAPIRPMRLTPYSANQRLPSGPAAIPHGALLAEMPVENSVIWPLGVIRPTRLPLPSVNQRLPSGPAAIVYGPLLAVMPV